MSSINIQYYKTPVGEFILGAFEEQLVLLDYRYRRTRNAVDNRIKKGLKAEFSEADSPLLQQTRHQLDEYLKGERKAFELPLLMVGTEFQKMFGMRSYKYLMVRHPLIFSYPKNSIMKKAIRAVASANGANSMSLIIPCHRIIGSDGQLVGYAGGLEVKRKLLNLEQGVGLIAKDDVSSVQESFSF